MPQDQGLTELQSVVGIHELFNILLALHVAIIQEFEIHCSLGFEVFTLDTFNSLLINKSFWTNIWSTTRLEFSNTTPVGH
jgi:hypothetical protein